MLHSGFFLIYVPSRRRVRMQTHRARGSQGNPPPPLGAFNSKPQLFCPTSASIPLDSGHRSGRRRKFKFCFPSQRENPPSHQIPNGELLKLQMVGQFLKICCLSGKAHVFCVADAKTTSGGTWSPSLQAESWSTATEKPSNT